MTVSPPLNPILCLLDGNGSLQGRDRAGAFTATGSGALRYAPAPGARVNRVLNARFASDTSRWQTNGGVGATHSRVADARFAGGFACRVFAPGDQPYRGLVQSPSGQVLNAPDSSVTQVTISFDIVVESGPISGLQAGINSYTADNAFLATPASANFSVSALNTLERKSLTANANANLYSGSKIVVYIVNGQLADSQFLISNIVLEFGSVPNATYFEGPWLDPRTGQIGTANASPSVSRAVFWVEEATTNLVVNPSVEAATLSGLGTVNSGVTLTKDATAAYLGASSVKAVTDGSVMNQGVYAQTAGGSAGGATTARAFTGSVYARGSVLVEAVLRVYYTDASNSETISAAITLSGGWQRLNVTHTTTAGKTIDFITIRLRQSGAALAATFFADCFQIEEKTYATSYCDGSLGTGYSWAGTAHASASSRAVALVSVPAASHYTPNAGAMLARGYRDVITGGAAIVQVTPFGDPVYDGVQFRAGGGVPQAVAASWWIANASGFVQSGTSDMPATTWIKPYTDWLATVVRSGVGVAALSTGARPSGAIGTGTGAVLYVGPFNSPTFGRIGPVLTYDQPLTDARRALVNAAIDSNGATDLWTLFEEWEAVGLPLESVALQAGQATAGVKAVALPMETSILEDGRATAGVRAVAQPMEAVERQGGKALALAAEQIIPAPTIRAPILAGRN